MPNQPNIAHRTMFTRDNLEVLRGIDDECIDLIYLDPPFNSKHDYAAPIGSEAAGAEFKDTWTLSDIDVEWLGLIADKHPDLHAILDAVPNKSDKAYLVYMSVRLIEMQRLLKSTGSIYLHCDPTMSHYLKVVMDAIFSRANFQTEITWQRTSAHNNRVFGNVSDCILFYGEKAHDCPDNRVPLNTDYVKKHYRYKDVRGVWRSHDLTGAGTRTGESGEPWRGFDPAKYGGRHWSVPRTGAYAKYIHDVLAPGYLYKHGVQERLEFLNEHDLIHFPGNGGFPGIKRYLIPGQGMLPTSVWTDIAPLSKSAKENTNYPTQKPLALLERIIKASSNEGNFVLDPFCGCATACVAAEKLGRQWIGIDISAKAAELVKLRAERELTDLRSSQGARIYQIIHRTDIPRRSGAIVRPRDVKHRLYGLQEGRCKGCEQHFEFRHFHVDHIIPRARGGQDVAGNLQLLCGSCNVIKGDRDMAYLRSRLQTIDGT